MNLIDGLKGPYDASRTKSRSANAGYEVAKLTNEKNFDTLATSKIKFTELNEGLPDLEAGMAYSKESLKALDTNGDGYISLNEFIPSDIRERNRPDEMKMFKDLFNTMNINPKDKGISASENLAWTIFQDCCLGKPDGIVTPEENDNSIAYALNDEKRAEAIEIMKRIYKQENLEEIEKEYKMPILKENAEENSYEVKKGDTLWAIAKKMRSTNENFKDLSINEIIKIIVNMNGIKNPNLIKPGQVLNFPKETQTSQDSGSQKKTIWQRIKGWFSSIFERGKDYTKKQLENQEKKLLDKRIGDFDTMTA
ncbi:MAG: LysM domain-containing protein [bacterium]